MADLGSGDVLLDASRHVRLVPRQKPDGTARRASSTIRAARMPRTTMCVFHMSSGADIVFNDPRRFGYMKIIARNALDDEPLLKGLGPEPLGNEFDAAMLARACADKTDQPEGRAARPARRRRARQHLCLRGALSRASVAATAGGDAGDKKGRADPDATPYGWSTPIHRR